MAKTNKSMLRMCFDCNKYNGQVKKWDSREVISEDGIVSLVSICSECKEKWIIEHPEEK